MDHNLINIDADYIVKVGKDDPVAGRVFHDQNKLQITKWDGINDGDYVFLKSGLEPRTDDIVLALLYNECDRDYLILGHYDRHGDVIALRSSNSALEDDINGVDSTIILGVCVAVQYNQFKRIDTMNIETGEIQYPPHDN